MARVKGQRPTLGLDLSLSLPQQGTDSTLVGWVGAVTLLGVGYALETVDMRALRRISHANPTRKLSISIVTPRLTAPYGAVAKYGGTRMHEKIYSFREAPPNFRELWCDDKRCKKNTLQAAPKKNTQSRGRKGDFWGLT